MVGIVFFWLECQFLFVEGVKIDKMLFGDGGVEKGSSEDGDFVVMQLGKVDQLIYCFFDIIKKF